VIFFHGEKYVYIDVTRNRPKPNSFWEKVKQKKFWKRRPGAFGDTPPERGCVPLSGTSRSRYAKPACWSTPDAAEIFNVLRLALCTDSRAPILLRSVAVPRMRPPARESA
jgi:hypothetical protein